MYQNWKKYSGERIDIINESNGKYSCWAITASRHQLASRGCFSNKDLEKQIGTGENVECSHIMLLNIKKLKN